MAIRKSNDISNEGSTFANQKNKQAKIEIRFDDTTHNDNPYDDAIQYLKKKVDEVIDETNTQSTASGSYAAVSASFSSNSLDTLNNNTGAAVTFSTSLVKGKTVLTIGVGSTNFTIT